MLQMVVHISRSLTTVPSPCNATPLGLQVRTPSLAWGCQPAIVPLGMDITPLISTLTRVHHPRKPSASHSWPAILEHAKPNKLPGKCTESFHVSFPSIFFFHFYFPLVVLPVLWHTTYSPVLSRCLAGRGVITGTNAWRNSVQLASPFFPSSPFASYWIFIVEVIISQCIWFFLFPPLIPTWSMDFFTLFTLFTTSMLWSALI